MAPTMSKAALLLSSYARRKRKGYCSRKRRLRPTCVAHSTSRRLPKSKQLSRLSKHTEAGAKDKGIYMQVYGIVMST